MCRWLERDPAGYQDGPSLYSYLGRNPMAGTDPYGLFLTDLVEGISFWLHGGKNLSGPQYHQGWRDGKRGRWKHYYVDGEIGATWWIPDHEGGNTWWTDTLNAGTQLQRERIDRFQEFRRAGANALAIGAASVVVAGMTLTPGPDELIAGAVLVRVGAGAGRAVEVADVVGEAWVNSVWALNKWDRGRAIEKALGHNLGNCRTIDKLVGRTATSIKSIDLNAKTYQKMSNIGSKLREYIDDLADFKGTTYKGVRCYPGQDFDDRVLELAIPSRGVTAAQRQALEQAIRYGASRGVDVRIIPFH